MPTDVYRVSRLSYFETVGIPVQETLLGTYTKNGKEKIVVACRDFTSSGVVLQDFASLKNTIIDSVHNGYGTELDDILLAIDSQTAIDPTGLRTWFWNVFIVDALIGTGTGITATGDFCIMSIPTAWSLRRFMTAEAVFSRRRMRASCEALWLTRTS